MFFFFCNDTATTDIYTYLHTLSLHDALPICTRSDAVMNKVRPSSPKQQLAIGRSPAEISPSGSASGVMISNPPGAEQNKVPAAAPLMPSVMPGASLLSTRRASNRRDRTTVVEGKRVSVGDERGGRRLKK